MTRAPAGGFALIELLLGLALAVGVVAATAALLGGHIGEQRHQRAEHSLHEALQSAVDLVAHDVRRSGHWSDSAALRSGDPNPYTMSPSSGSTQAIEYAYDAAGDASSATPSSRSGFRVDPSTRTLQMRLPGLDNWQPVTDPAVVGIDLLRFEVEENERSLLDDCVLRDCPAAARPAQDPPCGPTTTTHAVTLVLAGTDPNDASVTETLRSRVSIRARWAAGSCPA